MVSGGLQTLVLPCWIASAVAAWMLCGLLAARGAGFVWRRLWSPPRRDSRAGDSISAGDWSDADALPSPDPDDDAPPPGRRALRPELLLAAMIAIPLGVGCAIRSDGAFVRRSAERSAAATTEACREGRFDDAEAGVRRTFALARRSSGWEPGREDAFLHEIVDATAEFLETAPPLSGERGHSREQALLRPVACAVHLASDSGKDPTSDEEISALIYRFERMAARYEEEGELLHAEIVTRAELFLVDDPRTEESTSVSWLLDRLGRILAKTRPNDALAVLVRHLDVLERRHGESDPALLPLLDRFGAVLKSLNRPAEAETHLRRALAIRESNPDTAPVEFAFALDALANVVADLDRLEEAETLHRRSLDALEKELGVADAKTLAARARLADLLVVAKRFDEAEALLRASLEAVRADAKPDSFDVRYEVMALANLLASQGRHDESDALIAPYLAEIDAATTPEAESELLGTMVRIGRHLRKSDRPDRAEPLLRRALAIRERAGPDHREVASSLYELAGLLGYTSRADEALPIYRRALEIQESEDGPDDGMTLTIRADLGSLLLTEARLEEAERVLRAGIPRPTPEGTPPPGWTERTRLPGAIHAQADLAIALLQTGRREEGEREAERALELIRERDPKERSAALQTRRGRLLRETGRADEAVTALRRALELDEESFLEGHSGRLRSATELALALREAGLDDEAERLESENREIQRRFRERTGFQHRLSDGP